jgi:hypothetical protein
MGGKNHETVSFDRRSGGGALGWPGGDDVLAQVWTPTTDMNLPRFYNTQTLLNDGRVLVVGGFGAGTNHLMAEIYNPVTQT